MIRIIEGCFLKRHHVISDARGHLLPIEGKKDVPFPIKRIYLLYGADRDSERGFHAHRSLHQHICCVSGACTVLVDNGQERREVRLASPEFGVQMRSPIWREMRDFSLDCVLMVLASEYYDEGDYIRDYDEFVTLAAREQSA